MNNQVQNTSGVQQPQNVQQPVAQQQVAQQPAVQQPVVQQPAQVQQVKPKKKHHFGIVFLILIILGLGGYCYILNEKVLETENYYKKLYSPINATKATDLDINSLVVQDLYNRFKTDEKEDYFGRDLNTNEMKLYIALRNVSNKDYIDSNCNMFDQTLMQNITCPEGFTPQAVDEDILKNELKILYGDNHNIPINNIQLGNSCMGGYQYISGRKQFVEGKCGRNTSKMINVEKKLLRATTNNKNIVIREKVRYYSTSIPVPKYLRNGIYLYSFRLDNNYNYIFVGKTLSEEIE